MFQEPHDPFTPIYLHLSSDSFEPDLLLPDEEKPGVYQSVRMVPPGDVIYYFTKDDKNYVAGNQPKGSLYRTTDEFMNIPETNIMQNVIISNTPFSANVLQTLTCYPRPPPKSLARQDRLKTPWDFFKSVFKDYKADTAAHLVS